MELFQLSDDTLSLSDEAVAGDSQLFLTLSVAALSGQQSPKSLCLLGFIQGQPVRILIDSGSSHSFVSTSVAAQFVAECELPLRVQVRMEVPYSVRQSSLRLFGPCLVIPFLETRKWLSFLLMT